MKRHFAFSIRISVFAAVCFGSFVMLGLWQLDREIEKTSMLEMQTQRSRAAPIPLTGNIETLALVAGQRVSLTGQFDPEVILLLDNRVLEGRVGFEVHQLFRETSGNAALVNRGFVPMGRTRADQPVIPPVPRGEIQIEGRVHFPIATFLVSGADPSQATGKREAVPTLPFIVQHPDVPLLAAQLAGEFAGVLAPFVVRADEKTPGALPRYWPITVMTPERHRGYAVQWFAMALAVLLAWLAVSFPRSPVQEEPVDKLNSGGCDGK